MSGYVNNLNNAPYVLSSANFEAKRKPAVPISSTIDNITNKIDEEKEKKHNKHALTIGIVVAVAVAGVGLLNPRYSKKLAEILQKGQASLAEKINKTKNSAFVNKIYKISSSVINGTSNFVNFINNVNPIKDIWFKNVCTKPEEFDRIKNLHVRKFFRNISQKRVKLTSKIHGGITSLYENIGRFTVKLNYKKSSKILDKLENIIKQNLNKLSGEERALAESKLAEISKIREFFAENNVVARLDKHEECMQNLERDFMKKVRKFGAGYTNSWTNRGRHTIKNLYYWPEEILRPSKTEIEKEGKAVVEKLLNEGSSQKGLYNEVAEILSPHLDAADKKVLEKAVKKSGKFLRNSNTKECSEYFDKIRDLKLGSAPTDIVTAATLLGVSGVAIASADDRKRRVSRLVTGVIPTISGVGVSLGMAAGLVSGGKSLIYGLLATFILNRLGIVVDKHIFGNKEYYADNKVKNEKEIKNTEGEEK